MAGPPEILHTHDPVNRPSGRLLQSRASWRPTVVARRNRPALPRRQLTSTREHLFQAVGERLARQLLADVEDQAGAGVVDQFLRPLEAARVLAGVLGQGLGPVGMEGELGRAGGDAAEVAVPETRELERVVERLRGRAAVRSSPALVELRLAALVLLLGQVLQLFLERLLDLLLGRLPALAGAVEDGAPRTRLAGLAVQRRPGEVLGGGPERGTVAEGERDGLMGVAQAEPRRRLGGLGRDALRLQALRELTGGGRVEPHGLAAARDRRQDLRELVREQDQDDVARRLLERLEQRVRGLVVHRVGALEHEDPVLGLERRVRGGGDDGLADVAPEHLVRA